MRVKQAAERLENMSSTLSPSLSASTPTVSSSSPSRPPSKKILAKLLRDSAPAESETTLDYGDPIEQLAESPTASPANTPAARGLGASRHTAVTHANGLNGQKEIPKIGGREEGEISDEESRARRQSKRTRAVSLKKSQQSINASQSTDLHSDTAQNILLEDQPQPSSASANPLKLNSNKMNDPLRPTPETHSFVGLASREVNNPSDDRLSPATMQLNEEVYTKLLEFGIDDNHCRPGLPMTFEQFELAKGLILDLIGYGTSPEYLIDVGINPRLVVYCLRELKMRIPSNVKVGDIIAFGPPQALVTSLVDSPRATSPEMLSPISPEEHNAGLQFTTEEQAEPSAISLPSTSNTPPPTTRLNVHAEPFVPKTVVSSKPPKTTGPSLVHIALPHQQIGLPPRPEPAPVNTALPDPPSSLPQRPAFSVNAEPNRKSSIDVPKYTSPPSSPTMGDEPKVESDTEALQRMEQQKKLQLLRKKLALTRKRPAVKDSLMLQTGDVTPSDPTPRESAPSSTVPDERKVESPSPMDVDYPVTTEASRSAVTSTVDSAPSTSRVSTPSNQSESILTLAQRRESLLNGTRSSTPSELGAKRGIKRPKADDFLDKTPVKRPTLLNNVVPSKNLFGRSTFALINSTVPDQHVFTWSDDETLGDEAEPDQMAPESAGSQRESEAAQFAAAALAIGLPMTAEELEAARIQEEERKAQINAKAIKLLKTQLSLRKLELKQAEKKLKNVKHDDAEALLAAEEHLHTLRQELQSLETRLLQHETSAIEFEASTFSPLKGHGSSSAIQLVGQSELSAIEMMVKDNATSSTPTLVDTPSQIESKTLEDGVDSTQEPSTDPVFGHVSPVNEADSSPRFTAYVRPPMFTTLIKHHSSASTDNSALTNLAQSAHHSNPQGTNFAAQLCQFESGGGECKDNDCPDLHFRDFGDSGTSSSSKFQ